ncbi:MAG: DUF2330 domain-containing protein [Gemmataceae bacterium]
MTMPLPMPKRLRWLPAGLTVALATVVALMPGATPVQGCAIAPFRGEKVEISSETALIQWDAATKTETFTRQANFRTSATDFGFFVPTPTLPKLKLAKDVPFNPLSSLTAARHVYEEVTKYVFGFGQVTGTFDKVASALAPGGRDMMAMAPRNPVQVLQELKVGNYQTVSLLAKNPASLREWLTTHGYEARPALDSWFQKYTQDEWVLTAFKIAPGLKAETVEIQFTTPKPFYPYRETSDAMQASSGGRSLRVYMVSDQKMQGTLGTNGEWPGRVVWANVLPTAVGNLPAGAYLTEFEDLSNPRPGTDEVYFAPHPDPATVERPPIVHTTVHTVIVPGEWGLFGLTFLIPVMALFMVWRGYKRAAKRAAISPPA